MAATPSAVTVAVCILMITELILAKDYYDILGVPRDATERQIKKAFHRLAAKYHPDKNKHPDAERRFREIAEAYETLSDETRRREYNPHGDTSAFFTRQAGHQPFSFSVDDILKDFDIYSHNRHARHRRHFDKETQERQRRHSQGGFAAGGVFDDMTEDIEQMFSFERHAKQAEHRFHGASKQHCRTVTQRRGNMVTTYTECTAP